MNRQVTTAIVLSRTNYGEADRILTLLTADHGKLSAIAKGVRRERSKLAGGIELFTINEVGFLQGRGEMVTLTTTRLIKYFDNITGDIDRTMLGYDLLKLINKSTENETGTEYYQLLADSLAALNDSSIDIDLIRTWFNMQLLSISGHAPNLTTSDDGKKLDETASYDFDNRVMAFAQHSTGPYEAGHIKLLRLALTGNIKSLSSVKGIENYLPGAQMLSQSMRQYHLNN
jgi:DNA repair protein RecO